VQLTLSLVGRQAGLKPEDTDVIEYLDTIKQNPAEA
jgi:hypothetical protein